MTRWAGFLASEACKVTPETPLEALTYVGEQKDVAPRPPLPLYNCKCCKPARTYSRPKVTEELTMEKIQAHRTEFPTGCPHPQCDFCNHWHNRIPLPPKVTP